MKIEREEVFLVSVLMPLGICLIVLLSSVRPPQDLFRVEVKKAKPKSMARVPVQAAPKEETQKVEALPSLSQSLAPPAPSLGGDLQSLSAGLVSESATGSGGLNIQQGEVTTTKLVEETQGQSRPPRPVQVVSPTYPQSAQARGIEGYVILELVVSERGQVMETKVISAEPAGLFDQVAIEAVKKWSFEPGLENGRAVVSRLKQKVNFELN